MAERLGTPTEAREVLGIDMAELWSRVARGELTAERVADDEPWVIYRE